MSAEVLRNPTRVATGQKVLNPPPVRDFIWSHVDQGQLYQTRALDWNDERRHAEYQRLRARVFVHQMGWPLPIVNDREYDRYDVGGGRAMNVYAVYGVDHERREEQLLSGIRLFYLRSWGDAMLSHEFREAGVVPPSIENYLHQRFPHAGVIEITRMCFATRSRITREPLNSTTQTVDNFPRGSEKTSRFRPTVVRDLTYGAIFELAERARCHFAVGIIDLDHFAKLARSLIAIERLDALAGVMADDQSPYVTVLVNLPATIQRLRLARKEERAATMLSLCRSEQWLWEHTFDDE